MALQAMNKNDTKNKQANKTNKKSIFHHDCMSRISIQSILKYGDTSFYKLLYNHKCHVAYVEGHITLQTMNRATEQMCEEHLN